jgi:magnesium transporter
MATGSRGAPAHTQLLSVAKSGGSGMVVNCVAYDQYGKRLRQITLDEISDVLAMEDTFVWVGLHEPDEALLRKMQEEFSLHELALEDAQHAHQRPKAEVYDDTLFVVLHTAQFVKGNVEFGETHIFMGKRFLLTVRHGASLSYAAVRARCEQTPHLLALGPSFGLYAVMDFVVDNFFPIVRSFQDELQELEKEVFEGSYNREAIEQLYQLKRELVTLRLAVSPMQDILNQLMRFHRGLIDEEVRVYLRDVYDHAVRISEAIAVMGEMLTTAIQVNLSVTTLRQNEITKRLAGMAGLFAVPTMIFGYYGMNFESISEFAQRPQGWATTFGTIAVVAALYWRLKRAKWL